MLIDADWFWLILIDADCFWLVPIDADICWLMLFDSVWCFLMLKQGSTVFSFVGAYLRSFSGHFFQNLTDQEEKERWEFNSWGWNKSSISFQDFVRSWLVSMTDENHWNLFLDISEKSFIFPCWCWLVLVESSPREVFYLSVIIFRGKERRKHDEGNISILLKFLKRDHQNQK